MPAPRGRVLGILLGIACGLAGPAAGDVVTLWSGEVIEGKVRNVTETTLEVETTSGVRTLTRTDVKTIKTDEEIAAEKEAAREAARAAAPAPTPVPAASADAPALPTEKVPAGGWMLATDPDGNPLGCRRVSLAPRKDGGWRLDIYEVRLTNTGKPGYVSASVLDMADDFTPLAAVGKASGKIGIERNRDLAYSTAYGGGRMRTTVNDSFEKAPETKEFDFPAGAVVEGQLLARLLHGGWLAALKEYGSPTDPYVVMDQLHPDHQGGCKIDVELPGPPDEQGTVRFGAKIVKEFVGPDGNPIRVPELLDFAFQPGRPARLMGQRFKGLGEYKSVPGEQARAAVEDRIPAAWKTFAAGTPPAPLPVPLPGETPTPPG